MMYEAVWNSSRVAVSLSADTSIMREGLMGKELSEKPDAIENLTEFSTFYFKRNEEIYCGYMIKENQIIQI